MTPLNMARHRNSPHMAFWRMIKEGNDHFEVSRQEPKVDVCEKRYVFDAANASGRFDPRGKCPTFQVPDEIATPVAEKRAREDREFAALVARNTPTVAVKTGADGGMNKLFLAKLRSQDKFDEGGRVFSLASTAHVPDMGNNVNPPKIAGDDTTTASVPAVAAPAAPTPAAPPATRVASADSGTSTNMFGGLGATMSKWFGGSSDTPPAQPTAAPAAKPKVEAKPHTAPATRSVQPRPQVAEKPAA